MKISDYLRHRNVQFQDIDHSATLDANLEELHVPRSQVAKTVLLRSDDGYVIAIVPSTRHVDCEAVRALLGARNVELATESDAAVLFPDFELGVVPPFGSQYGLRTVVDVRLAACELVVFEGGPHTDSVCMAFQDFDLIEMPIAGIISKSKASSCGRGV